MTLREPYPIPSVHSEAILDPEPLGSKKKFWFLHDGEPWLFKEARNETGEHWAEKIAAELATKLGIPAAQVELASYGNAKGCALRSFVMDRSHQSLIHGNELLAGSVTDYDRHKRFHQRDHTLTNIIRAIEWIFPEEQLRRVAAEKLCGYVVLDALIGNTDRHHENWGLLATTAIDGEGATRLARIEVAPSFDHASSLGRELHDNRRERHLAEHTVERYLKKGRGGIFERSSDQHGASPLHLALSAMRRYPSLFAHWIEALGKLDREAICGIVEAVPRDWMSGQARDFAVAMMILSREKILMNAKKL